MPSTFNLSDITDSYGQWTYNDELIYYAVEDHDNWQHRELVLRKDHFIRTYINKLDEEIWAEKPITTPDIFGEKKEQEQQEGQTQEDLKLMNGNSLVEDTEPIEEIEEFEIDGSDTDISKEWERERWSLLLTKLFNKARVHSYCVVQLYNKAPFWRVFCDREITQIYYDNDDVPLKCDVVWSKNKPKTDKWTTFEETITFYDPNTELSEISPDDNYGILIPFGAGESEDMLGEFDLEDKWTLSVSMRYARLDVTNNSAKTSGFYWLTYGSAIDPTSKANLDKAFDMAGASSAVGAKETVLQNVTPMYPAKPEFTIEALAEFTRQYSSACRLPLSYFRSESDKGSMFGDMSGDEIKVNKKKMFIFGRFKSYIIDLIYMRWGIELEDITPYIYESEEEEIDIPGDENDNPMYEEKENKNMEVNK